MVIRTRRGSAAAGAGAAARGPAPAALPGPAGAAGAGGPCAPDLAAGAGAVGPQAPSSSASTTRPASGAAIPRWPARVPAPGCPRDATAARVSDRLMTPPYAAPFDQGRPPSA